MSAPRLADAFCSVTLWLSNLCERESHTPPRREQDIVMAAVSELAAASRLREVVAVSNEIGGGIVPSTRVGRRFRDLQGWANQILVVEARSVVLVVAGLPLILKTGASSCSPRGSTARSFI